MCGVSGVFHYRNSGSETEASIRAMSDTLVHRGPDDAGTYLSPDRTVGLGSRRLKIIDLSPAGHMPMTDASGRFSVTYNGEVYNFRELRSELEAKGHTFRSTGDTEVILEAYREYGPACVERFNGMFAFALWDEKERRLFCARDHVGIKPFYYATQDGVFYFASEIQAILAHPSFKKELNEENIGLYLTFSSMPAPHTLFRNVRKLPPAHTLSLDEGGEPAIREYWNPFAAPRDTYGETFYRDEVRRLLRDSIRSQMVSDVPFGCFLSGGIDSSTNAALMSEALGTPVETFSVGSKGFGQYNEFEHSRRMAALLHATTHETLIDESSALEFLERFPYSMDDPVGDQACLPLFFLSRFARENGVIVVQVGEGSDELFAGYDTYRSAYRLYRTLWRFLARLPAPLRRFPYALSSLSRSPRLDFAKEYLYRLANGEEPFWGLAIAFGGHHLHHLLTPQARARLGAAPAAAIVRNLYAAVDAADSDADFLKRITAIELKHRLGEFLLMRADKMMMAHSVEGRVPFLDRRLVELAFQIPTALKFKNGEPKYILKRAVEGIIPHETIWRKKQGFGTPISEWLRNGSPIAERLVDTVRHSRLRERGLLDLAYVERIVAAHGRGAADHSFRIWNLITLSRWYDHWFS
jgi:asparagine synthase (glutamine-hydrolysing)